MRFFNYYRLLTITHPTKRGFGYMIIFVILYMIQWNLFFSEEDTTSIGAPILFILAVFAMSVYAYQARTEPTTPIYQFPITAKERTRYDYENVLFVFVGTIVFALLFFGSIIGLIALLGNAELTEGEETVMTILGDLFGFSHLLFVFGLVMPLSYVIDTKRRYLLGGLFVMISSVMPIIVSVSMTGKILPKLDLRTVIHEMPYSFVIIPILFVLSVISVLVSCRISERMNAYR
ncbi:MAG: ABC-2 transporter permease [Acholeplasmataceae bacterium]|nr:ABC-2 transporter permease [Acholeplasmataceae bacterium]